MSRKQIVEELHKNARKNFKRRRVIVKDINETLQADLVEMLPYAKINKNNKYLLTVIDIFSKYAWAIPVKNKTGKEIAAAMFQILKDLSSPPKNIHTDLGKEFYNVNFKSLMEKYGINHYSTYSTMKASIVERFNRTLKEKMWKQFSLQGTYKWLNILQPIVNKYNDTIHSTIKMRPNQVKKKHTAKLLSTVYANMKIFTGHKFNIGDYVRVSKYKNIFDKGYTPNWSTEIFKIIKVQITNPVTYLLQDYQNEPVKGGFYEYELLKVKNPNTYLVEKIIRRKADKVFVKWLGFDSSHNSWINKKDMI